MVAEDTIESETADSRYGTILRSTSVIALASVISVVMSVIRLKVLAVLLGPVGVGLFGLFNVISDLAASLAGMGVQQSGVRQAAVASSTGDQQRVARIARVLNLTSWILGSLGAVVLIVLSSPIAKLSFDTEARASGVMLVGLAVLVRIVAGAPLAMIQGCRRIEDLARMTVIGAVLNTIVAIPLVYLLGEDGVVPSIIAVALTSWVTAHWYARKIRLPRIDLSFAEYSAEARLLLQLGVAFMASGFLTAAAALLIRILIVQQSGVDAAGNYQAAWALGGIYVGFILQSMGTDFYPRLSAAASDNHACNQMVNEQARVSILLAGPGLLATLALSPLVIAVFYSTQFVDAVPLLRWLCVGMLLRVVAWPMGFIVLAKGDQKVFFWTEVAAAVVHVGLAWLLLNVVGLVGAGVAFVGLYAWHGLLIYVIVRRMSGFAWARENLVLIGVFVGLAGLVLAAVTFMPFWPGHAVALGVTVVACWYSLAQLVRLVPQRWIPLRMRPLVYFLLRHRPAVASGVQNRG